MNIGHELEASLMLKIIVSVTQMNYMMKDLPKNSEVSFSETHFQLLEAL